MKFPKYLIILLVLPFFAFTTMHKYYISVTQVNYVEEKQSLQIISRIFIDDFENALRDHYDKNLILAEKDEPKEIESYIEKYLKENLIIKINNNDSKITFIGKEYDGDIIRCYLEVEDVNNIESFEISNKILFDLFADQQNIIKTKINSKQKSVIHTSQTHNTVLNFN
tara:strand:- start:2151 stop:2654 length:504 start_codon:yes stop_codon:yes gene_type:complete